MKRSKIAWIVSCVFVLGAILALAFYIQNQKKLNAQKLAGLATSTDAQTITYKGKEYVPKKNIETYLFVGVDSDGKVKKVKEYGESGMADTLILLVRDLSAGTYQTLSLDRNTMTEIKCVDVDGSYIVTVVNQLSFAHAEGDGLELSCENTVDAVSNLLKGQKIDGYAVLNMSAIRVLNHEIGGVEVTIEDDFSQVDPTMEIGKTMVLDDTQAEYFVRGRMNVADGTNENRMKRQNVYLDAYRTKMKSRCVEDAEFPLQLYDALGEYMVTTISAQKFSKLAMMTLNGKDQGSLHIEGKNKTGEMGYIEFTPDKDSLQEVIISLFYREK